MWSIDFDRLFENYNNYQKWDEHGSLVAFLFGDVSKAEIRNVLFNCLPDFETALDLIRFLESSLPSNITFIGVLSLTDIEYPFDLNSLSVSIEDAEDFLNLFADMTSLNVRDTDKIMELNKETHLRPFLTESSLGRLIVRTSLQLNININVSDKSSLLDQLNSAFFVELSNIDSLCFTLSDSDFILGRGNAIHTKQLHEAISQRSECLFGNRKFVDFIPLVSIVKDCDHSVPKLVPIVKIEKGLATFCSVRTTTVSVTEVHPEDSPTSVLNSLRRALKRTLYLIEHCLCEFITFNSEHLINITCGVFLVYDELFLVVYPRIQDDNVLRMFYLCISAFTKNIGAISCITVEIIAQNSTDVSTFRLIDHFYDHRSRLNSLLMRKDCYGIHIHSSDHDGVDDSGWGCAYRSFQTIWSWFVLQGYIDKPVPTHREIQKSLYECGDKDASFVGSHQWIGSLELGYCLENMAGIESRIIATNSGIEVMENASQLALHFKTYGTPVMIGGGMLAHTILGIDLNQSGGKSSFLVLDPHYTGEEDVHTVITKGWCGWKKPNFWKQENFYNLLLPIPPQNVI